MQLRHVSIVLLGGKTAHFATKCISFSSAGVLAACHMILGIMPPCMCLKRAKSGSTCMTC